MRNFLESIKNDLDGMSPEHVMISVTRKDLESLVKAYETLLTEKKDIKRVTETRKETAEMNMFERRKIMHAAANMDEMRKEAFICRIFGYMEQRQDFGQDVSPEKFFQVAKEEVERLTKGSVINAR